MLFRGTSVEHCPDVQLYKSYRHEDASDKLTVRSPDKIASTQPGIFHRDSYLLSAYMLSKDPDGYTRPDSTETTMESSHAATTRKIREAKRI